MEISAPSHSFKITTLWVLLEGVLSSCTKQDTVRGEGILRQNVQTIEFHVRSGSFYTVQLLNIGAPPMKCQWPEALGVPYFVKTSSMFDCHR